MTTATEVDVRMDLWEAVKQPPAEVLKPIKGGRMSGKTDISPIWRYEELTKHYGPCGQGWKVEIVRAWVEPGADQETTANVQINLYVREADDTWSAPIPGFGGTLLVASEREGLRTDDDAFKKSLTDALSVACKFLGFAADIYKNLWDGSKYVSKEPAQSKRAPSARPAADDSGGGDPQAAAGGGEPGAASQETKKPVATTAKKPTPAAKEPAGKPTKTAARGGDKTKLDLVTECVKIRDTLGLTSPDITEFIRAKWGKQSVAEMTRDEIAALRDSMAGCENRDAFADLLRAAIGEAAVAAAA